MDLQENNFTFLGYHGTNGPIKVIDNTETPTLTDALLNAAREIGDSVADTNGQEQIGTKSLNHCASNLLSIKDRRC